MKILLALICIVFYANCVCSHGIRAKRGLSVDEQKKLLDVLNKDRQEYGQKQRFKMRTLTYNTTLEKELDQLPQNCDQRRGSVFLKWNDNIQKLYDTEPRSSRSEDLFLPHYTSIACSKTFKCSMVMDQSIQARPPLLGKTGEFYGICRLSGDPQGRIELGHHDSSPPVSKYADIIGVTGPEGSGSERTFGVITFLIVMIFM